VTRTILGTLALALAAVWACPAAEPAAAPPPHAAAPLELVLLGEDGLTRLELRVEVDGTPVPAIWDETFARLFAFFDRNGDGALDAKEAARLPSPLALRQAMGSGFTPPVGSAPAFADLDRDGDGKATPDELAAFYRAAGVGNVLVGVGRLPAGGELTAALLKSLDTDGDGKVTEREWKAAVEVLKKLDTNDDELIGAGELVPKALYPGAAGTTLLTPPAAGGSQSDALTKLPLVLLPADHKDTHWATEVERRNPRFKAAELPAWRKREPDARWVVRMGDKPTAPDRFALTGGRLRVEGWLAGGKMSDAVSSARRQVSDQFDRPAVTPGAGAEGNRRRGGDLAWLTPIADRDGDGRLDRKELDAWLDLQAQIARGQVLATVLDGAGLFELLDTNHDGALSARELRTAWDRLKEAGCVTGGAFDRTKLPRVLLATASRGYPQSLAIDARRGPDWFRAMDRNGDGDVSRREFTGPPEVFDRLDLDRDGLLSPEEAEKALTPNKSK
jgi:Ca2+-binding EF-hand superfamily protein